MCARTRVCGFTGYPSFQGLAVGVQLSLSLPCPPTGTDGHPRSSLISPQSGSGPALPRCGGPCFKTPCQMQSPPSACPLIVLGEPGRERESNIPQHSVCSGILSSLCFARNSLFFLRLFFVFIVVFFLPRPLCRFPAEPREGSREGPEVTLAPSDPTLGKEMWLQYGEVRTQALSRRACICMLKKEKKTKKHSAAGGVTGRSAHLIYFVSR